MRVVVATAHAWPERRDENGVPTSEISAHVVMTTAHLGARASLRRAPAAHLARGHRRTRGTAPRRRSPVPPRAETARGEHAIAVPLPTSGALAPPSWARDAVSAWPWRGGLEPCGDHSVRPLRPDAVEGSIPADLRGSLFRVGPGRCRVGGAKYAHWFDGDGAVFACSFEDGDASGREETTTETTTTRASGDKSDKSDRDDDDDDGNQTRPCSPVTVRAGIKFVRTPRFAEQERAGVNRGVAVRGAWTQANEAHFPFAKLGRFPSNPSNTAPLVHDGQLFALCEGGAPVRIDARTLDTLDAPGEIGKKSAFKESAGRRLPMGFSAHAKRDSDGALYTWGLAAPPAVGVQVARISSAGEVTHVVDLPLCPDALTGALSAERLEFTLIHDCAMSAKHLVFVVPPWRLKPGGNLAKALAGATSFGHAFEWDDTRGAWLVVLRKSDLSVVAARETKRMSTYHFCGARDESARDACVVLVNEQRGRREALEARFADMYASRWAEDGYNTLCEYVIDLETGSLVADAPFVKPASRASDEERARGHVAGQLPMEFPVCAPSARGRAPRFVYTLAFSGSGGGYFDAIQKLEAGAETHATRFLPAGVFPSEVEFVPRRKRDASEGEDEEDAGYLLYLEYDAAAHASSVVVLDAQDIAGAELARIRLPFHVPYTFHGTFEPE